MQVISILFCFYTYINQRVRFDNWQKVVCGAIKMGQILKFLFRIYSCKEFGDPVENKFTYFINTLRF